ncbi:MAG: hypothetical protein SGJ18_03970 [Pseudomonadota bacterium]|nr:hypothetical protein [Pseudomonadota bacterium]
MSKDHRFSEVGVAYNTNIACLDEARQIFEKELNNLNAIILDHLFAATKRLNQDEKSNKKMRWQEPEDDSRDREGSWLNHAARVTLGIDVKIPGAKVFRKNSAYLYFETVYDKYVAKQFVFQCRFENQGLISDDFDEKVYELVKAKGSEFQSFEHIKTSTTILFRLKLTDALFDHLNHNIDIAMQACLDAANALFPDSAYSKNETSTEPISA